MRAGRPEADIFTVFIHPVRDQNCFRVETATAGARGLQTCPQETVAKYHRILRECLPIAADELVVCGMSMSFGDDAHMAKRARMPKLPIADFVEFVGF